MDRCDPFWAQLESLELAQGNNGDHCHNYRDLQKLELLMWNVLRSY